MGPIINASGEIACTIHSMGLNLTKAMVEMMVMIMMTMTTKTVPDCNDLALISFMQVLLTASKQSQDGNAVPT
jgi:hypothetical protein